MSVQYRLSVKAVVIYAAFMLGPVLILAPMMLTMQYRPLSHPSFVYFNASVGAMKWNEANPDHPAAQSGLIDYNIQPAEKLHYYKIWGYMKPSTSADFIHVLIVFGLCMAGNLMYMGYLAAFHDPQLQLRRVAFRHVTRQRDWPLLYTGLVCLGALAFAWVTRWKMTEQLSQMPLWLSGLLFYGAALVMSQLLLQLMFNGPAVWKVSET